MRTLLIFLCCVPVLLPAQFALSPAYPEVRDAGGQPLPLAWLGGLNAPQYLQTDLDGDGIRDLYLFDRAGDAQLALRGTAEGTFLPAPNLTRGFPADLTDWVILRDYDGDGIDDVFAYSADFDGFRVHRGRRDATGLLTYDGAPTFAGLRYPFNGGTIPIFVTSIDYPAVDDLDGDGDLDILTFSVGGGYVEYYRNYSVERGFGRDSLLYELETDCWGGFFESGLTSELSLAPAPGECFGKSLVTDPTVEKRHSGSTILTLDADGNGRKDIMLGDISFEYLVLGLNKGTREEAWISSQDPTWRSDGVTANIPFFPAAYLFDADGDGIRDLLASPSQTLNAEDLDVGWYYRNAGTEGTPSFVFQDSQWLVRQTVDFGTGGLPAAFDYDADGRPDLVVGNTERYSRTGRLDSRLRLFRNVPGAGGAPVFRLVDEDYLQLSRFQTTTSAFSPAFGDLDGDGDTDAVIGERAGKLIYLENVAGSGAPAIFADPVFEYMGIDVGQLAKPDIADLDRDGRADLVVGGFDGRVRFYRNTANDGPAAFDPDEAAPGNFLQLGGINTNKPGLSSGHPAPRIVTYDDRFLLLAGNRSGTLEAYRFTDYTASFTALGDTVAGLDLGGYTAPAAADFDNDGFLDLIVGNERGGITYFASDLEVGLPTGIDRVDRSRIDFNVHPNPTEGWITLSGLPEGPARQIRLLDGVGRELLQLPAAAGSERRVYFGGYPAGVYFLELRTAAGSGVRKIHLLPGVGRR